MKARTLARYLVGSRAAILEVAQSKHAFWIGMVFVLSAGFAREYDGESLIHEPWHALRPLAASFVSGSLLYLVALFGLEFARAGSSDDNDSTLPNWCSFMGLFWLTAPMAWLYAIPYERFLDPIDAVVVNLWTLAIVAAWRVLLMVRVISVIHNLGLITSFFLVMLYADIVAFTAMMIAPTPVIDVMGGLRHTERDALIVGVTLNVKILSILTAPVWFIGALVSVILSKRKEPSPLPGPVETTRSRGLAVFSICSVIAFVPALWIVQPEQYRRFEVERRLRSGDLQEAFSIMSAHQPEDYPPNWNPPPRLGYRETIPPLDEIVRIIETQPPVDWVARIYLRKIDRDLKQKLTFDGGLESWRQIVDFVTSYPGNRSDVEANADRIRLLLDHHDELTPGDRAALRQLLEFAGESDR